MVKLAWEGVLGVMVGGSDLAAGVFLYTVDGGMGQDGPLSDIPQK